MSGFVSRVRSWIWGGAAGVAALAPAVAAEAVQPMRYRDAPIRQPGQVQALEASINMHFVQLQGVLMNILHYSPLDGVVRDALGGLFERIFSMIPTAGFEMLRTIAGMTPGLRGTTQGFFVDLGLRGMSWTTAKVASGFAAAFRGVFVALSTLVFNNVLAWIVGGFIRRIFNRADSTFLQIDAYFAATDHVPATATFSSEWRPLGPRVSQSIFSWPASALSVLLLNPRELFGMGYLPSPPDWVSNFVVLRAFRFVRDFNFFTMALFGLGHSALVAAGILAGYKLMALPLAFLGIGFTVVTSPAHLAILAGLTAVVAYWKYRMASGVTVALEFDQATPDQICLTSLTQMPVSNHKTARIADENGKMGFAGIRDDANAYHRQQWIFTRLTLPSPVDAGLVFYLDRFVNPDAYAYDRHALRQALFRVQIGMLRSGAALTHLRIDLPPPSPYGDALAMALPQWQGKLLSEHPVNARPQCMEWRTPYALTEHVLQNFPLFFHAVAPFLLTIQKELVAREIDRYVVTEAPIPFTVALGTFQITLTLEARQANAEEFSLDDFAQQFADFRKVRELPGNDLNELTARIFLRVTDWEDAHGALYAGREVPAPEYPIVLRFLYYLCLTCRWYLYVPWSAELSPFPFEPLEFMDTTPPFISGGHILGYIAPRTPANAYKTTPFVPGDRLEAILVDHFRQVLPPPQQELGQAHLRQS